MKERKEGKKYKRDELPHGEDDEKNQRKHHYVTKNYNFCTSLREIYKNIHSSNLQIHCLVSSPLYNKFIVLGSLDNCLSIFWTVEQNMPLQGYVKIK